MANSDNVIRAGLTPKLRDIPNLISGLTYSASPPSKHTVTPAPFSAPGSASTLYDPPIPEFSVVQVKLQSGGAETHRAVDGPSILIITEGKGKLAWADGQQSESASEGDVLFVGAGTEIALSSVGEGLFVLYRAFVEA
jgi:mannose-6-phosphate isomerase